LASVKPTKIPYSIVRMSSDIELLEGVVIAFIDGKKYSKRYRFNLLN
jgi:hypothetical protein